ncbi:MAG: uroporphyrinogen-III synthase [Actinomycetota bacterium]
MRKPLAGYAVGVTADRRSEEQISLLEGRGASCLHGPTIRTHPLRPEEEIRAATETFLEHPPSIVILSTGIGVRGWLEAVELVGLGDAVRAVLESATLLSRGPKAKGAAVTAGFDVEWNAPSALYTEIVDRLVDGGGVDGTRIAVQQDGSRSEPLIAALENLGADVQVIPVYRWSLPEDVAPAATVIKAAIDGRIDAVTFTARPSVQNMAIIAEELEMLDDLRGAFATRVIPFSIGPVCAVAIREAGFGEPCEARVSRLGALITCVTETLVARSRDLEIGGRSVELRGTSVSVDGEKFEQLSVRERDVLEVLAERPGVVWSKADLLQRVWQQPEGDPHLVEVTVGRLRRRLGIAGEGVETVVRRGYRISAL